MDGCRDAIELLCWLLPVNLAVGLSKGDTSLLLQRMPTRYVGLEYSFR
jgi:hypothetical protein